MFSFAGMAGDAPGLLLAYSLKVCLLLVVAKLLTLLTRRASAATRHLIWNLAFAAVLLLPLVAMVLPGWRVELPASPITATEPIFHESGLAGLEGITSHSSAAVMALEPVTITQPISPYEVVILVYIVGAVGLLMFMGFGMFSVRSIIGQATPMQETSWLGLMTQLKAQHGICRPVRLLVTDRLNSPVTFGLVRPVILVPRQALDWTQQDRRNSLCHELSHVARCDWFSQLIANLACVINWFNPLIWMAVRQQNLDMERSCDDRVLASGFRASDYARHLVEVARHSRGRLASRFALTAMAGKSHLSRRVVSILNPSLRRTPMTLARMAMMVLMMPLLLVPLAAFQPVRPEADLPALDPPITVLLKKEPEAQAVQVAQVVPDLKAAPLSLSRTRPVRQAVPEPVLVTTKQSQPHVGAVPTSPLLSLANTKAPFPMSKVADRVALDLERTGKSRLIALAGAVRERRWDKQTVDLIESLRSSRAIAPMIRALGEPHPVVRMIALRSLGKLNHHKGISAMAAQLTAAETGVRQQAILAMRRMGHQRSYPYLLASLVKDEAPELRKQAGEALRSLLNRTNAAQLIDILDNPDLELRVAAASFLGEYKCHRAVKRLAGCLNDREPELRQVAAWALGEIKGSVAVQALKKKVSDRAEHPVIRAMVCRSLGLAADERQLATFLELASDPVWQVRAQAILTLGRLKNHKATPVLRAATQDANEQVRLVAEKALDQMPARWKTEYTDPWSTSRRSVELEDPTYSTSLPAGLF